MLSAIKKISPLLLMVGMALSPMVARAQACADATKLPGVANNCRTAPQANELDASQSTYWFDKNATINGACNTTVSCMLQKGTTLCASVAKLDGLSGSFACANASTDCNGSPLSQTNSLVGAAVCPGTQVCCILKTGASAAVPSGSAGGAAAGSVNLPDPLGGVSLPVLIGNVIRTFAGIAGAVALLMFVYGGIMWIISGGEEKKVAGAQKILKNASIGLVLIFGAYFFVATIIGGILSNPAAGN
jgi:hypothetical protein